MDIETFLLNSDVNDMIFGQDYRKRKIHKEKFDDRFVVIYSKTDYNRLKQDDYEVCGYLDVKDGIIYDCTYYLSSLFPKENHLIRQSYFSSLEEQFWKKYLIILKGIPLIMRTV